MVTDCWTSLSESQRTPDSKASSLYIVSFLFQGVYVQQCARGYMLTCIYVFAHGCQKPTLLFETGLLIDLEPAYWISLVTQ